MNSARCVVFSCKKNRFVKEQQEKRFLSSLGLKTIFSRVPWFGDILFWLKYNIRRMTAHCRKRQVHISVVFVYHFNFPFFFVFLLFLIIKRVKHSKPMEKHKK